MEPERDAPVVRAVMDRQRACRRFAPTPLDDALVEDLLVAATRAPSAENSQPWVFVVVRSAEIRAAVWDLAQRLWEAGGREATTATGSVLDDSDDGLTGGFATAPVTVVVGADLERCRPETASASVFPAVQNLLLAATAVGLGSALTTIATVLADDLRAVVDLPETVRPMAVVPLGHPARRLGPSRREPIGERAHRERFGRPW